MRLACALLCLVALGAACGGGGPERPTATPASSTSTTVAPLVDTDDFAARYDDALAPLGLRVSRAGITDGPADDAYDSKGSGTHAAVYLVPKDAAPATPDAYLERVPELARLLVPDLFDHLPVTTVDVCQEALHAPAGQEPATETVLLVSRRQARELDWSALTLADYIAMYKEGPVRVSQLYSPAIRDSARWKELAS